MSKIKTITGVTESGIIRINKSCQAIIIEGSFEIGYSVQDMFNDGETITIEIERVIGGNVVLYKDIPVNVLMTGLLFGESPLKADGIKMSVPIDLSHSSIALSDGDNIKVELKGLIATYSYTIHTLESPLLTTEIYSIEEKQFLAGEKNNVYKNNGSEVLILDNFSVLRELRLNFINGSSPIYTKLEILTFIRDIDSFDAITYTGSIISHFNNEIIAIPLTGVESFELTKVAGAMNLYFLDKPQDD